MSVTSPKDDSVQNSFLSKSFLELEKVNNNLYRVKNLWKSDKSRSIFGGIIIGQAILAASENVPDNQHLHSFHSFFVNPANTDNPIFYQVENTRDGRTYSLRTVHAMQGGKMLYKMEASFKIPENSSLSYQIPLQEVPSFTELPDHIEAFTDLKERGILTEKNLQGMEKFYSHYPIEIKWVDTTMALRGKADKPKLRVWLRASAYIGEEANFNIHKSIIGYMVDLFMLHTSEIQQKSSMFQTSLDHCMWFHSTCRADEWVLLDVETYYIGDGRTFVHGFVRDQHGRLVATVSQEGVCRERSRL